MKVMIGLKKQRIYKIFKVGVVIMTLASMLGLSGCGSLKEFNKPKEVKMAERMLREKYNEEFLIYSMGGRFGTLTNGTFTVVCSPQSNPDLKFKAEIDKDGFYMHDEYISTRVSALIEDALTNSLKSTLKDFVIKVAEAGTSTELDNSNISIEEYYKTKPNARFVIYLVIDKANLAGVSSETLYNSLNLMLGSVPKLNGSIMTYFATNDVLQEAGNYIKEHATISSTFEEILQSSNNIFTRYTDSILDMPLEEFESKYK